MKWQAPMDDEYKIEKHFALWPRRMNNGNLLWMESYYVVYRFTDVQGSWLMSYWYPKAIFAERDNEDLLASWKRWLLGNEGLRI